MFLPVPLVVDMEGAGEGEDMKSRSWLPRHLGQIMSRNLVVEVMVVGTILDLRGRRRVEAHLLGLGQEGEALDFPVDLGV